MSELGQEPTPEVQAATGQPEQPNVAAPTTTTEWTPDSAAAEIKKLRAEAAKYRKEREAAEKAAADAAEQQAAEQGKYKELWEKTKSQLDEYEPMKARLSELTERTVAANEARIKAIPDGMKGLVPEYDDPFKLSAWLDANSAVFQRPAAPSLDAGAGGTVAGNGVDEAKARARAIRVGVDPDLYIQAQKSATR